MSSQPAVQLRGVAKQFSGVYALKDVDFELRPGEVHALLGENGAGKSTLVKILAGIHRPDAGDIAINGESRSIDSPEASRGCGIAVVHQDPVLFPDLTVAENIFLEDLPRTRIGAVDWRALRRAAGRLLDDFGVSLPVGARVQGLSAGQQQLIEIARALSFDAKVLILDEPTSALSAHEVEHLFEIVRGLRARGVAIAFVGHRLEEVFALANRITVLRDGAWVATAPLAEMPPDQVIRHMVGRDLDVLFPKTRVELGDTVLEVLGLTRHGHFSDVSFTLRQGEILGFAGLVGAGRTEVAHALFGVERVDSGQIVVDGDVVAPRAPADMVHRGVVYVPEDRQLQGAILDMSIESNITLPVLRSLSRLGLVQPRRERAVAQEYAERLQVRASGLLQAVGALSGGNQQKVVLAKWLLARPKVIILDDPTRGIDIGTKAEVHRLMSELASQGLAIILISNELPEVLAMSDRLLVFNSGRVAATFDEPPFDEDVVMQAAIRTNDEAVEDRVPATTQIGQRA